MYEGPFGSVIRESYDVNKIVGAFFAAARLVPLLKSHRHRVIRLEREARKASEVRKGWIAYEVASLLNDCAPPFFYFGQNHLDLLEWGWWLIKDWQEELKKEGGVVVTDLKDVKKEHCGWVALVEKQGEITLYQKSSPKHPALSKIWNTV